MSCIFEVAYSNLDRELTLKRSFVFLTPKFIFHQTQPPNWIIHSSVEVVTIRHPSESTTSKPQPVLPVCQLCLFTLIRRWRASLLCAKLFFLFVCLSATTAVTHSFPEIPFIDQYRRGKNLIS